VEKRTENTLKDSGGVSVASDGFSERPELSVLNRIGEQEGIAPQQVDIVEYQE
jgi:hypothetical protein